MKDPIYSFPMIPMYTIFATLEPIIDPIIPIFKSNQVYQPKLNILFKQLYIQVIVFRIQYYCKDPSVISPLPVVPYLFYP